MGRLELNGVELWEAPESVWSGDQGLIGQDEALALCRIAAGLPVGAFRGAGGKEQARFFPALLGPPGTGKTTLAFQVALEAARGHGVYAIHCAADLTAEDLIATPVASVDGGVHFRLSPFATAALRGGAVILDEAARLDPSAWASLLGAFDERGSLVSVPAGVTIPVREGFTVMLTMGSAAEVRALPPAVRSRLGPYLPLRGLTRAEEAQMVRRQIDHMPDDVVTTGLELLGEASAAGPKRPIAPREVMRFFHLYDRLSRAWPARASRGTLGDRCLGLIRPPGQPRPRVSPTGGGYPQPYGGRSGVDLRVLARDLFEKGNHAEAERVLRYLLSASFEIPGTHCHLARLLAVTGRGDEARREAAAAWDHRTLAPAYVVPRILWFEIAYALLDGRDPAEHLRRFSGAVREPGATMDWLTARLLDAFRPRLPTEAIALLETLAGAAGGKVAPEALEAFPCWRMAHQVPAS